ncbi:three component ABC system middle component [Cellulomonas sp. P24]|uniref:three component ABC system middle component n=1 Tax=Cellulomonas sp. P24 TaxID=2885206 RepID=UPI00216B21B5|nr:three component ABC system middle component [Cellulomonas sp. P24]MCR6491446.1 DUF6521 family protein [Cellulomonas sp. P24]
MTGSESTQERLEPWSERSAVAAAMFNPALVAVIIAVTSNQYRATAGLAMPWPLSFLACPMVLHGPTRSDLPRQSRTSLASWVSEHEALAAGFAARARNMSPLVCEGVRFGLREGLLRVVDDGRLHCDEVPSVGVRAPADLRKVVLGAGMLGRVFGRTGDPATIFATLRVRP